MKGKSPNQNQKNLFRPILKEIINPNDPLVILCHKIDWATIEKEFAQLYSNTGTPAKPIRLMVGLLILKQMFNHGDETLMPVWVQNPYYQYFCGESEFQWDFPCDPSDLVHFRKRIGAEGMEQIFTQSVKIHKIKEKDCEDVIVDTTVQEKNITFPTDTRLQSKIIERCNKIAKQEGIELRQSYTRTLKRLRIQLRFSHHPKRRKQAKKAQKKIKIIAGRQLRDLTRKLSPDVYEKHRELLEIFAKILKQTKTSKNKIYSIHEPETACIAKGKLHKQYEFGSKVSFAMIPHKNIIVGVVNFKGNPNDTTTLEPTLEACKSQTGLSFKNAIVDRGYKGHTKIGETKVILPGKIKPASHWEKQKIRKKCRSRAAIEPIIGHIKVDCRMFRNYLKGNVGDQMNAILAASAMNFRQYLKKIKDDLLFALEKILLSTKMTTYFFVILIGK